MPKFDGAARAPVMAFIVSQDTDLGGLPRWFWSDAAGNRPGVGAAVVGRAEAAEIQVHC